MCSSQKAGDGHPAKRMKCEESSVQTDLEGLTRGRGNLGESPKTPDGTRGPEDPADGNTIQQQRGDGIPETHEREQEEERDVSPEPQAVPRSSPQFGLGGAGALRRVLLSQEQQEEQEEEESSCGSALGEGPGQREHCAFSDEDSNQPLPVHRFFGDVELDLPAVPLPSTTRSRREARKLHFKAKEEEEEEEEDVV